MLEVMQQVSNKSAVVLYTFLNSVMYRFLRVHIACCSSKIRIHYPCKPKELRREEPALSVGILPFYLCHDQASCHCSSLRKASKGSL